MLMNDMVSSHCIFLEGLGNDILYDFRADDILTLSKEQTAQIILPFLSHPHQAEDWTRSILSTLGKFNTAIADKFVPKISLLPQLKLRLLSLEPPRHPDDASPSFVALSYCCAVSPTVCCDGEPGLQGAVRLPLSKLISAAVIQDLKQASDAVWCDQICINQSDMSERAVTLGFTDAIYRSARVVVVALDDVQLDHDDEVFLRWFAPQYDVSKASLQPGWHSTLNRAQSPPFAIQHPEVARISQKILAARWFRRAWCAHEMRVSMKHLIYIPCGPYGTVARITADFLEHLNHLARETPPNAPPLSAEQFFVDVASDTLLQGTTLTQTRQSPLETYRWLQHLEAGGNPGLEHHLRKQTASLDKFIISLNSSLCGLTLSRQAFEYGSTIAMEDGEFYRWMVALALAMRDPLALCASGISPRAVRSPNAVPWWQCPQYGDCSVSTQHFMSSDNYIQNFAFDAQDFDNMILLSLSISRIWQRRETSLEHMMLASAILHAAAERTTPQGNAWNVSIDLSWSRFLRDKRLTMAMQILGCILECGPLWLLNLLALNQGGFVSFLPGTPREQVIKAWEGLGDSWPECLTLQAYANESKIRQNPVVLAALRNWMCSPTNFTAMSFILQLVSWISLRSLPLTTNTDSNILSYRPYIWTFGEKKHTHTMLVLMHDIHRETKVMPSIATPLLEDKFHDLRRCWLVSRDNVGELPPRYRLCERQLIYGPSVKELFAIRAKVSVVGPQSRLPSQLEKPTQDI